MERVFITYSLREDVPVEDYIRFSQDKDQAIVPHAPGILRFDVHLITGAVEGTERIPSSSLPFHIVETVDVSSWSAFERALATPDLVALGKEFAPLARTDTVRMAWGRQL